MSTPAAYRVSMTILAFTLSALIAAFNAFGQGLSNRPVRVIVATTPGTTPDVLARVIAPRLQEKWNQPFVVENRAGAAGMVGMEAVAKSAPDGHTINFYLSSALTLPFFFRPDFDVLNSFTPIGMVAVSIMALVVHKSVPVKDDLKEFIAYAKQQGPRLNYGSPGNGTYIHLVMEQFKLQAGLEATHIPYKGFQQATTDLLAGRLEMMFLPVGVGLNLAKGGNVRLLGGSGRDRSPLVPELRSLNEQGLSGFHAEVFYAVSGPASMPADIVTKYNAELRSILQEPAVRDALAKQHLSVQTSSPDELDRINRSEYASFEEIIRKANIKGD